MTEIYNDSSFSIEYDEENKILIQKWFSNSSSLWEVEIKQKLLRYLEILKKLEVKKLLVDIQEGNYPVSPQLSQWIQLNILNKAEDLGLQKTAILAPKDLVTAILSKNVFDINNSRVVRLFFSNETDAKNWLLAN